MTVKEVVTMLCEKQGLTVSKLAELLDVSQANVSQRLNKADGMGMKVETLVNWLDKLECQIVISSYDGEDEYILDGESEL